MSPDSSDFDAKLEGHKKKRKERLQSLEGVVGVLLLVTHVSDTKTLRTLSTVALWTTGGRWRQLRPTEAASSFDDVWDACPERKHRGQVLKQVPHVLREAGKDPRRALRRITEWTRPRAGLGVKKANFFKLKTKAGTGSAERWYAARSTFLKVWPALKALTARRRR